MKKIIVLFLLLPLWAQTPTVRLDPFYAVPQNFTPNAARLLQTAPGSSVTLCYNNSIPCNSLAVTYTDVTGTTMCPNISQVTVPNSIVCSPVSGVDGKFGWWVLGGINYWYSFTPPGGLLQGPFPITAPSLGGGGGGGGGTITGVTAGTGLSGGGTSGGVTVNLNTPVPVALGGTGTATPSLINGTNVTITGTWPNQTINAAGGGGSGTLTGVTAGTGLTGGGTSGNPVIALATPVSVPNGGNGTSSPALVAGSNVTITGSWPNQTINSSGGAAFPGTQLATSNGTSTTGIAASITACGTSISCSVIAPPSYGTAESVPGFSIDPNQPIPCLTSSNIIVHDLRYGDGEQGCDYIGYNYSLQRTMHPWQHSFSATEYPGEQINVLNILAEYFAGGTNQQTNTYGNKNTQSAANFAITDWTNGQLVNTGFYSRHYGLGDTLGLQFDSLCWQGGMNGQADEGCEAEDMHVYQGIGNNQWQEVSGTVGGSPATGATSLALNIYNGFRSQANGGYVVDTSKSYSTGTLSNIAFSGGLHTYTFSGTAFPVSPAHGILTAAINAPTTNATFSLSFTTGSISNISVGSVVCVSDGGSEEMVKVLSVGSSSFTAASANSHQSGAYFGVGGACGSYVAAVADDITSSVWTSQHIQAINGTLKTGFPVVYSDATHLYVHVAIAGYYGKFTSRLQSTNNAYFLYPGAQVVSVGGGGGLSTTLTLSPNTTAWTAGDNFYEIPFPAPHYIFSNNTVESYQASIGNATQGNNFTLNQPLHDNDTIYHMVFGAPQAMYEMHGGPYNEPKGIVLSGETSIGLTFDPTSYSNINANCDSTIHNVIGACDGYLSLYSANGSSGVYDFGVDFTQNCFYVGGHGSSFARNCVSTGTASSTNATQLQGYPISATAPTNGQVLAYNSGSNTYLPTTISGGGASGNATSIQSQAVSSTPATNGQTLVYNSGSSSYVPTTLTTLQNGLGTTKSGTGVVQVNVSMSVRAVTGTSDTLSNTDCGGLITYNNSGSIAVLVPQPGLSGNFLSGCPITIRNYNTGSITLTPSSSTIGNGASSQTVSANKACLLVSDGTNWQEGACN